MPEFPKRCAVINDFSGFGRCSISVALPVLSAMNIQCCSVPTAILSNHTGYPSYFFDSYTNKMPSFIDEWKKLDLSFDCIFSGFLGCKEQIDIVCGFIDDFKDVSTYILVDPVMGDNGSIYATYTPEMCEKMKVLSQKADIITPNITEACILSDTEYMGESLNEEQRLKLLDSLSDNGKRSVVITGIINGSNIESAVFDSKLNKTFNIASKRSPITYPGTGDLFASVLCANYINSRDLYSSTAIASDFVSDCAFFTSQFDTDKNDGIAFEPFLNKLIK